jgi:hypothetical protein
MLYGNRTTELTTRVLGILGIALTVLIVGAGLYAYLGFYNVAASNPHTDAVRWSLEEIQPMGTATRCMHARAPYIMPILCLADHTQIFH